MPSVNDLKQRVITCLNRLSDRDTLSLAATELDSIALNLTPETFSLFITCLQTTDSSSKTPVRKHCVSLLSVLSRSHGVSLTPHLPKMVSTLLRRLRDQDSVVRAACVTACVDMTNITPFSILLGPMIETLLHECDPNAQVCSALCLAAAVEASTGEVDVEELRKALPKIGKLLKSDGFKEKAELLGVIGSVVGAVRGSEKAVLDWLLPNVYEFLSSDDWRARKGAAEVLERVALVEDELVTLYKKGCVGVLESRRFDKVKLVRDTMNRTLTLWKRLDSDSIDVSESSIGRKTNTLKGKDRNVINGPSSSKQEDDLSIITKDVEESKEKRTENQSTLGAKRVLFQAKRKPSRVKENGSNKSQVVKNIEELKENGYTKSQVVQNIDEVKESGYTKSHVVESIDEEVPEASGLSHAKNAVELSMIRNQITQIEKQQSSLLDLFQRFMESSQNGMQSLERRVRGLETSLSVISTDLIVTRTITQNGNYKRNACLQN